MNLARVWRMGQLSRTSMALLVGVLVLATAGAGPGREAVMVLALIGVVNAAAVGAYVTPRYLVVVSWLHLRRIKRSRIDRVTSTAYSSRLPESWFGTAEIELGFLWMLRVVDTDGIERTFPTASWYATRARRERTVDTLRTLLEHPLRERVGDRRDA